MIRLRSLGGVVAVVALVYAAGQPAPAAQQRNAERQHTKQMEECARACADCMRECDMCARYCADLIAAGNKQHLRTLSTCADCAAFCAAAARVVSQHGPMSGLMCDSCAKACDICATECERFPDDAHMKRCAEECRRCARACREMLKHVSTEVPAR